MTQAIYELTLFIFYSGFNDVDFRNIPVINNSLDAKGNRKIALFDFDYMTSSLEGMLGSNASDSIGLLRCVPKKMGSKVIEKYRPLLPPAEKQIFDTHFPSCLAIREQREAFQNGLIKFYNRRKIVHGEEEIPYIEEHFIHPQDPCKLLAFFAKSKLIPYLNGVLKSNKRSDSSHLSLEEKRQIPLNPLDPLFHFESGVDPLTLGPSTYSDSFLGRSLSILCENGFIFGATNGSILTIQA